jgi:hypothetical protein
LKEANPEASFEGDLPDSMSRASAAVALVRLCLRNLDIDWAPAGIVAQPIGDHSAGGIAGYRSHPVIVGAGHDESLRGQKFYQPFERVGDVVHVAIDVRMIEFHRGKDQGLRVVMKELRVFVKEGAIIFVALHDEERSPSMGVALSEIEGNAANEESRCVTGAFHKPG